MDINWGLVVLILLMFLVFYWQFGPWGLFQVAIVFGVMASDIQWHWIVEADSPSYLPAILGFALAWLATKVLTGFLLVWAWLTRRRPSELNSCDLERLGEPDSRDIVEPDRKGLLGYRRRPED